MNEIFLESLEITNFQKFKHEKFNFGKDTEINGENGSGKTTIYSSLTWLLFGKDSHGKDTGKGGFEIKPIDDGEIMHHLDTSVKGTFKVSGELVVITRLLQENWTKGKDKHYVGDENKGFIDDVPVKIGEFETFISEKFLPENVFRMIIDINYFLSYPCQQILRESSCVRWAEFAVRRNCRKTTRNGKNLLMMPPEKICQTSLSKFLMKKRN